MKAVNGTASWIETHYEIVSVIAVQLHEGNESPVVKDRHYEQGTGGMYELAEELTDKFEQLHEGRAWDGEFFDAIEEFITAELTPIGRKRKISSMKSYPGTISIWDTDDEHYDLNFDGQLGEFSREEWSQDPIIQQFTPEDQEKILDKLSLLEVFK